MTVKRIGILGDVENFLIPTTLPPIVHAARNSGFVYATILFGNTTVPALASWNKPEIKQMLLGLGASWSPIPKLRPGKNSADIALTYEATRMVQKGLINEVWIISSDSDFTPLVERLTEQQIRVVVFGSKSTPPGLRKACSSFVLVNDIQTKTESSNENIDFSDKPLDLHADKYGWFHGFIKSSGKHYGFIQISAEKSLHFSADMIDAPMLIENFRNGDPVEFKLGRNHKGWTAIHVRRTFALKAA